MGREAGRGKVNVINILLVGQADMTRCFDA
jgi:hypothetical protein